MESEKTPTTAATIIKTRSKRVTPPAHYILKINSFSRLSEIVKKGTGDGKYESDEFEAFDYKWKLVLYPNGNRKRNAEGHITLYLASTDKKAISSSNHVNMLVNFFVYDHIRDKYLTIQDGKIKRYNVLRTEHGFDHLLSLAEFNDSTNGYLVDDCCIFGVEINVIKNTARGNELSFITDPPNGTLTWKIDNFSKLEKKHYYSEVFIAGGFEWSLLLYPKGELEDKDHSVSLYLHLDANNATLCPSKVYAEYNLLVKDQINGIHCEVKESDWFGIEKSNCWGYQNFMRLSELRNASKGYIVNDTLIIEAKITLISVSQNLIS